jgi:hypothetical protein
MTSADQKAKHDLAYLDIVICETMYEIDSCDDQCERARLRAELDVLERKHHELLIKLRGGAA